MSAAGWPLLILLRAVELVDFSYLFLHRSRDWFNLNDNAVLHFPMRRIRWVRAEVPDPFLDLEVGNFFVGGGLFVVHDAADTEELLADIEIPTHHTALLI